MKRLFVCIFFAVALGSIPLAAQGQISPGIQDDVYVVQPGDSAWKIAGDVFTDPTLWREVVSLNPILNEHGRITVNPANSWTYVMMHPGEKLFGLKELGILPTIIPISQVLTVPPATITVHKISPWTWWLLALALLFLIACYLMYWSLTRDPATSGPAIVPGGISPENAEISIQEVAARQYRRETGNRLTSQYFTVLRSTPGHIWGVMNVSYANGSSVPRQLHGERAYEALVRFPGGKKETIYMLQACGNDLRFGNITRYLPGPEFRFEADQPTTTIDPDQTLPPDQQVQPEPATQPTPEPEPVTVPATEAISNASANNSPSTPAIETGVVRFEFRKANNGQPSMVRLQGIAADELFLEVGPNVTTLRYRELVEIKN